MPFTETKPREGNGIPTPSDTVAGPTAFIDLTPTPPPPETSDLETGSNRGPENEPETELNPQNSDGQGITSEEATVDASQVPIPDQNKPIPDEEIEFGDDIETEEINYTMEEQALTFEVDIQEKDIRRWKEDGYDDF